MGVSQFKQPVQPAVPPRQPAPVESPRWEIGIDRNKVAAFIGVALIAGFGFGYLAARYLAWSRVATDKERASAHSTAADPRDPADNRPVADQQQEFHKVSRIISADTIEADAVGRIRMIGINAPGSKPLDGTNALAGEAVKFTTDALLGKEVRIELEPSITGGKDDSGNTLAYVYTRDGALFNEEMIKQGDAFAKVDQPSKYLDRFRAAEREAMENMRGVWSPADKSGKNSLLASAADKSARHAPTGKGPDFIPSSIPPATLDPRTGSSLTSDPMIYVSGADRMYHKDGCEYLGKKGRPMMLSEAKAAGYVACGRCFASTVMKAP